MFTRMLLAQPRHVVAKLNGLSSAEECDVLRSVIPSNANDQGEQCYSVAAVRLKAESYRHQVTLGTVLEHVHRQQGTLETVLEHVQQHEDTLGTVLEHVHRTETTVQEVRDEQRDQKELINGMGEQISHVNRNVKQTQHKLDLVWNGLSNSSNKGRGATPAKVGKADGWSAQRVRRYARKGWFPKSLLPHLKNGRYAFNPNKVEEDIADIKKRLGIGVKKP